MGFRETLNKNKPLAAGVSILFLIGAGAILYHVLAPTPSHIIMKGFYSDDDGQTWFVDDMYKSVPFDHNGKQAVKAAVYTYDDGKNKYVAYLQKYTDEYKKKLDAAIAKALKDGTPMANVSEFGSVEALFGGGIVIKLPGPGHQWISRGDGIDIMNNPSPDKTPRQAIDADE